jgi:hypothetical protein
MRKDLILYSLGAIMGIIVWIGISMLTQKSEAWDSPNYFKFGLPFLMFLSGVFAFIEPRRAWRWGVLVIIVQPIAMFMTNPGGNANLLPLGLLVFGVLMIPCVLAAYIGVGIRLLFLRLRQKDSGN